MLKTLLLVLAGLVAGLAVAVWLAPGSPPPTLGSAASGDSPMASGALATAPSASAARLTALEDAFAAEVEQRVALEAEVAELKEQLEGLRSRSARDAASDVAPDGRDPAAVAEVRERFQRERIARTEQGDRRFVERLIAEGFAPDRAEWLTRRTEELRMQVLQAQYDAQRGGRPVETAGVDQTLRAELGEVDYERYLSAYGRPTAVPVRDVLASSPAERSGLQPGDEIVAYGGRRVFDMRELNTLTLEGTPGESVLVDVRRDGQTLQLVIPRGPIGITGGGFRGR